MFTRDGVKTGPIQIALVFYKISFHFLVNPISSNVRCEAFRVDALENVEEASFVRIEQHADNALRNLRWKSRQTRR